MAPVAANSTSQASPSRKGAKHKKKAARLAKEHKKDGASLKTGNRASTEPKIVKLITAAIDDHCMMTLEPVRNEFRFLTEKLIDAQGKLSEQKSHLAKFDTKMLIKVREGNSEVEKEVDYVPADYRFNKLHFQMSEGIRHEDDMKQASMDGLAAQDLYKKTITAIIKTIVTKELKFLQKKKQKQKQKLF